MVFHMPLQRWQKKLAMNRMSLKFQKYIVGFELMENTGTTWGIEWEQKNLEEVIKRARFQNFRGGDIQ